MKGKKKVPGSVPASPASNWQCCRKFRAPGRPQSLCFSGQFNYSTAASGASPSRHSPGPSHAAPRPHRGLRLHSSSPTPQQAGNKCKSPTKCQITGLSPGHAAHSSLPPPRRGSPEPLQRDTAGWEVKFSTQLHTARPRRSLGIKPARALTAPSYGPNFH